MNLLPTVAMLGFLVLTPHIAHAHPCTDELPRGAGDIFSGTVRYVGDGDSLCVGNSDDPGAWIEVRLADFDAPELHSLDGPRAKRFLEAVALERRATCTARRGRSGRVIVYDRVIAVCQVDGRSVGDLLPSAGAPTGGN